MVCIVFFRHHPFVYLISQKTSGGDPCLLSLMCPVSSVTFTAEWTLPFPFPLFSKRRKRKLSPGDRCFKVAGCWLSLPGDGAHWHIYIGWLNHCCCWRSVDHALSGELFPWGSRMYACVWQGHEGKVQGTKVQETKVQETKVQETKVQEGEVREVTRITRNNLDILNNLNLDIWIKVLDEPSS